MLLCFGEKRNLFRFFPPKVFTRFFFKQGNGTLIKLTDVGGRFNMCGMELYVDNCLKLNFYWMFF